MHDAAPKLITVGVIANAVGSTPDRVRRVLRNRRYIRPVAYADQARLFHSDAKAQVQREIIAIDAMRAGGGR